MKNITLTSSKEFAGEDSQFTTIIPGYINKTVCGCGLTSVALENKENIIIAVPNIYLTINKQVQYPNDRFDGEVLAVWGDTKQEEITDYINETKVIKIMCTYDSLPRLSCYLDKCKLIIDESQALLSNTKLKPQVINELFKIAKKYKDTVSFISSTPTPLNYMPEWVSEIDQVTINWENTRKAIPILCERTYPFKALREEFVTPLNNNKNITVAGRTFSKAIIFINTVNQISEIIKDSGLKKKDCGIICGDSLKNDVKINGIKRYNGGVMPKFLFITSSGFCGIDIEDNDAMTIVVSNTSKTWQMIDIMTDLKQAISRQRNKNNPNYGSFIYIFNQSIFKVSEDELIAQLEQKKERIRKSILIINDAIDKELEDGFVAYPDFSAFTVLDEEGKYYKINEQSYQAAKYFIVETRRQYTKGFDIKGKFEENEDIKTIELNKPESSKSISYSDLVDYFNENHKDGAVDWTGFESKEDWIVLIESSYRLYKKVWKNVSYATEMINNYGDDYELIKINIKALFSTGKTYSRKEVKEILQKFYDENNIIRKAKHSDLNEIITELKDIKIKGERFIEIIKK